MSSPASPKLGLVGLRGYDVMEMIFEGILVSRSDVILHTLQNLDNDIGVSFGINVHFLMIRNLSDGAIEVS